PFGENHRYDLIIDGVDGLKKIQVKTGRLRNGAVLFNCCSSHTHRGGPASRPYAGEIDFFAVYCAEIDSAYLVPIDRAAATLGTLRIVPPSNGQSKRVRWADDYRIAGPGRPQVGLRSVSGVQAGAPELPL
ncbi:MAG: group I intron-associated PD-(D/E)XK endonuclease, partial [Candidatus Baltobacteraceae bacterium]